MAGPTIKLDLRPARRIRMEMLRGRSAAAGGVFDALFKAWGRRYLAFTRRRYTTASRSPGSPWPDLAESTKKKRRGPRKGYKAARSFAILKDTGTLFNALTVNMPGNLFQRIAQGIRVGFGGPARAPGSRRATIAEIAGYHQLGSGRLPKREILVKPDQQTIQQMTGDLKKAMDRLGKLR